MENDTLEVAGSMIGKKAWCRIDDYYSQDGKYVATPISLAEDHLMC